MANRRADEPHADAIIPCEVLTRRIFVGASAGLLLGGCKSSKWETKPAPSDKGIVEVDLKDHPELVTPGGMIAVRPSGSRTPVLVMRIENDQFRVMSLRCPHLGCTVRWDNEQQLLVCPCHRSRFADDGTVLEGPAKEGLQQYPNQVGGTLLQFKIPQ